jgi:hypothetical protein
MDRFLIFQTQTSVYMDTIAIVANNFLLLILKKTCEKGFHSMDRFLIFQTQSSVYMDPSLAIVAEAQQPLS